MQMGKSVTHMSVHYNHESFQSLHKENFERLCNVTRLTKKSIKF